MPESPIPPESDSLPSLTSRRESVILQERALHYFSQVTDSVVLALRQIEDGLELLDARLDELQPGHSGRVRLMWISRDARLRGYEGERMPVAAAWHRHKLLKRWSAKKLPLTNLSQRAMSSGEFAATAEQVREVLRDLQALLTMHKDARGRLAKLDGDWARALPQVTRRVGAMVARYSGRSQLARHD